MKEYQVSQRLMGSNFTLGVVSTSEKRAYELLDIGIIEIKRIEELLSEFLPASDTSKINSQAHNTAVHIASETFELITRCQALSKLSQGDFDITVSPLKKLYRFKNEQFEFPDEEAIMDVMSSVGYDKLNLDPDSQTVKRSSLNTKISFAAIGKGYASDRVKKIWQEKGVQSAYINASGDLNAFGMRADGSPWKIGIANPNHQDETLLFVPIQNASVATSGDYEQFFMSNGVRYSHNINPHTGKPLTGLRSVTVFSPSAELSDALATIAYVKGVQKGLEFINQLPETHCIFINEKNKLFFSDKLKYENASL